MWWRRHAADIAIPVRFLDEASAGAAVQRYRREDDGQARRGPRDIVEETIANALVDLASAGQRNPEQLTRYAEYRASLV